MILKVFDCSCLPCSRCFNYHSLDSSNLPKAQDTYDTDMLLFHGSTLLSSGYPFVAKSFADITDPSLRRRHNRLIIRNLSFQVMICMSVQLNRSGC
jgi:hypothetical protein